jgi:hypothetical protein
MHDELKTQDPQDGTTAKVLDDDWEIRYFSQRLGWTPKQLKEAVKRAGIMPPEVRKAWRKTNG